MSSFFTLPSAQRKRKRNEQNVSSQVMKKRNAPTTNGATKVSKRSLPDDEISGSESGSGHGSARGLDSDRDEDESDSDHEGETAAERRLRLAERYLENIRQEVDEVGFDAEQIDKDLIAERLKEDVAESKGRIYRHIAGEVSFTAAIPVRFRADTQTTTSIAMHLPFVYTVSKDGALIKWEVPRQSSLQPRPEPSSKRKPHPPRRRPKQVIFRRGRLASSDGSIKLGHTSQILAVACSPDGKYVATGGLDRRLIVWRAKDLVPIKTFPQHRDAVVALAFRRGSNQLFSASRDRTIKVWSLDELAYVETLFGHQDQVVDVAALAQERCVSVGARDRSARLWKVVEETQLVFRGGGTGSGSNKKQQESLGTKLVVNFSEGSIDRVAQIDEEMFVTGSDNGSICLWSQHKKKPIFTVPLAHGLDPPADPAEASAEIDPPPRTESDSAGSPRWITALTALPYTDIIVSGSWDGYVRVWRVSADKKRLEAVGVLGDEESCIQGIVNDLAIEERSSKTVKKTKGDEGSGLGGVSNGVDKEVPNGVPSMNGEHRDGPMQSTRELLVAAAVGKEHKAGRWMRMGRGGPVGASEGGGEGGGGSRNGAVLFYIPFEASVPLPHPAASPQSGASAPRASED